MEKGSIEEGGVIKILILLPKRYNHQGWLQGLNTVPSSTALITIVRSSNPS